MTDASAMTNTYLVLAFIVGLINCLVDTDRELSRTKRSITPLPAMKTIFFRADMSRLGKSVIRIGGLARLQLNPVRLQRGVRLARCQSHLHYMAVSAPYKR